MEPEVKDKWIHQLVVDTINKLDLAYADTTLIEMDRLFDDIGNNLEKIEVLSRRCL